MRSILVAATLVSTVVAGAAAAGQQATPEDRKAMLEYPLSLPRSNQLITALDQMSKYLVSLPDFRDRMIKAMAMTPAERKAQMEKDPKAMAILKQNGLTSQDYLIGVPALRMALMAAQGMSGPNVTASPANIAFAKANLAELRPKMDAADMMGRKQ
jgi:hypothetical protein